MSKIIDLSSTNGRKKFYTSKAWRSLRRYKLAKEPFCEKCLKRLILTAATEVHHVEEVQRVPEKALDIDNLQSLCKSCHSEETAAEAKARRAAERGGDIMRAYKI